ncbi:hypothetical protein [Mycobacterium malmoense]|nr:hypothetical protein [Mycobacterium malmoense]
MSPVVLDLVLQLRVTEISVLSRSQGNGWFQYDRSIGLFGCQVGIVVA